MVSGRREPGAAVGAPLRVHGPAGPWRRIGHALREQGTVLVYGLLDDWIPREPHTAGLRQLLGREWNRYETMAVAAVRDRFAASRCLIKHVAGYAVQAPPHTVELAYKPGGRPYLRGCDQLDISLSHTGDLLLLGITRRGGVGVDAEPADRQTLLSGSERRFWTPHEIEALAGVGEADRPRQMVRLWTLKEAYSKAIGQGMRFRFNDFGFPLDGVVPRVLTPHGLTGTGDEWSFGSARVEDKYTVSWALHDAGGAGGTAARLDRGLVEALTAVPVR
ncbi:4'-phosphopantetheinyl transferase superfamily protein [Streptomyces sp. 5-8]|uniref:4'-phosphopantetheinyl transferase superfamily protein n=1 Tax=Streptomyces musisoli TaxID=2802280 RepID=A0ABS1P393_9ACTN|nr:MULTISPECIES: 4'-phosphopantetheinyl transferase superfamily protein [Streptomyces]MBL1106832.1 4'-phosphopantetheinyl transferase superfamily protein [Streptomyces musisoli]MBY8842184.1 4'-phosphopantetheinyl transferase superfamily protein [Streptomyces sp. SP2-10]